MRRNGKKQQQAETQQHSAKVNYAIFIRAQNAEKLTPPSIYPSIARASRSAFCSRHFFVSIILSLAFFLHFTLK